MKSNKKQNKQELIKIHNDYMDLYPKNMTQIENNLAVFFLKDLRKLLLRKKKTTKEYDLAEIRKKAYISKSFSNSELIDKIHSTIEKFSQRIKTDKFDYIFLLYSYGKYDYETKKYKVGINNDFIHIFNKLYAEYSILNYKNYASLKSTFSQRLLLMLSKFQYTGIYKPLIENLKKSLGVPNSYSNKDIIQQIVKPSIKELKNQNYFEYLNYKIKKENQNMENKKYHILFLHLRKK